MKKKPKVNGAVKTNRTKRFKLTAEESLRRMEDFDKRKERFIAAIRKNKD